MWEVSQFFYLIELGGGVLKGIDIETSAYHHHHRRRRFKELLQTYMHMYKEKQSMPIDISLFMIRLHQPVFLKGFLSNSSPPSIP